MLIVFKATRLCQDPQEDSNNDKHRRPPFACWWAVVAGMPFRQTAPSSLCSRRKMEEVEMKSGFCNQPGWASIWRVQRGCAGGTAASHHPAVIHGHFQQQRHTLMT